MEILAIEYQYFWTFTITIDGKKLFQTVKFSVEWSKIWELKTRGTTSAFWNPESFLLWSSDVKPIKSLIVAGTIALSISGCQVLTDRDNKIAGATIVGSGAGALLAAELYGVGTGGALAMFLLGSAGAAAGYYLAQELLPEEKQA